ncbi:ulp1 protease family protein [Stemphylium lycopersici]|uniref:Ulp1 protease family protein n=1 Tax=Stemphylium lycopersici TaxID=183478 RepID=A0A364NFP5_STELY|nr:ulp1 protease family protein [Stemphylium lycopersici]RAR16144.1 ulp1 protease family protein [Stemphylium lycopersici]
MSLQENDAVAESPNRDPPPLPLSRDSPPASKSTPTFIDLSSPTNPPRRHQHDVRRSEIALSRPTKRRVSDDEKRLVGDYDIPADAVHVPHPSSWMGGPRKMYTKVWLQTTAHSALDADIRKPGSSKGYKPIDTFSNEVAVTGRNLTTYGKHTRPRPLPSLIGHAQGPGQAAYSDFQRSKASTTPTRRAPSRDEQDSWTGGTSSAKRRKTEHVINLEEDDDDDEVLEVARMVTSMPAETSYEKPLSARSSQSRLSIGSGSTVADFKPCPTTSEFREVDDLLKPSQKKPRRPSSSRRQGAQPNSPFASGSMSSACQSVFRDFQQGEDSHSPKQREQQVYKAHPVTSKHFPNARINESTMEEARRSRPSTGDSADLRTQHRPAPKRADLVEDSDSADELVISPSTKQKASRSKAKKAAGSLVKQAGRGRDGDIAWPLSFARSHVYEGHSSRAEDSHDSLILRCESEGLRVQTYSVEGFDTKMLIPAQRINRVFADNTSRIRLDGPRDAYGSIPVFDLQFLNSSDFLTFRDTYAAPLTRKGQVFVKDDEHMQRLFTAPLQPKNDKIGTSELVNDAKEDPEDRHSSKHKTTKTPLWDRLKHYSKETDDGPALRGKAITAAPSRPSRSSRSAPNYIADSPTMTEVSKYSIDEGLGRRWTKSLEYGEGRQRAIVHFDDLPRLDEEEYLNDSLIDFYMIYLHKQLQVPENKVYFFNTYFFTRLTENAGRKSMDYKAVERWTSKVDIFAYDYIVVPINESQSHWYLAIICNVSNLKRNPILQDFDEPCAPAQEQLGSVAQPVASSDNDEHTTAQATSNPKSPMAPADSQSHHEEDPSLLEDSLSLVDRDDPGSEAGSTTKTNEVREVPPLTKNGPENTPQTTVDVKPRSQGGLAQQTLTFAKSKPKRKLTPKRDPCQPVIVVLDSLGGSARSGAVRALKDWVAAEGEKKRGMEAVITEKGYYPRNTQIPMQHNWSDCGVYLLGYVEKFFQNPDGFMQKLLTGSMSATEDWPELKPSEMRHKIRKIIFECHDKQEEARKVQKKAKKESAVLDKKLPAHTAQEAADSGSMARPSGCVSPEKSPTSKTENDGEKRPVKEEPPALAHPPISSPKTRLGSPFKPQNERSALIKRPSQETTIKVCDSPPVVRSSVEKASATPRSDEKSKRRSPKVRVPGRTPQSHKPASKGSKKTIGSPPKDEPTHQNGDISRSPSVNKRRRQDEDNVSTGSPKAKRQSAKPRRQQKANDDSESKAPSPNSGKGSAANMPIEIEDSQEMQVVDSGQNRHFQPSLFPHRRSPSHSPRPKQTSSISSSLEEILSLSRQEKNGGVRPPRPSLDRQLEAKLDKDDHARRSRAPSASAPKHSLTRIEEVGRDAVEAISQSTDRMQLDGVDDGSIVRETPEPDRRSPAARK